MGGVHAGNSPSWHAATTFTHAYVKAIWKALAAAPLISAAIQALLPRSWLLRVMNRRGRLDAAPRRGVGGGGGGGGAGGALLSAL